MAGRVGRRIPGEVMEDSLVMNTAEGEDGVKLGQIALSSQRKPRAVARACRQSIPHSREPAELGCVGRNYSLVSRSSIRRCIEIQVPCSSLGTGVVVTVASGKKERGTRSLGVVSMTSIE